MQATDRLADTARWLRMVSSGYEKRKPKPSDYWIQADLENV